MSANDGYRLVRRALGWRLAPADVLRLVREDAHPVALSGTWAGGSDVIAAEPVRVRSAPGPLGDVLDAPWPAGPSGPGAGGPGAGGPGAGGPDPGSPGTGSPGTGSPGTGSAGTGSPAFGGGWIG